MALFAVSPRIMALALAMTAGSGSARAADVTWDAPQSITGTADVSVLGAYFGSWAPYDSNALQYPVNGVTFQTDDLGITTSGFTSGGAHFGSHTTTDADYNYLLQYGIYSNGTTASITLNGNGAAPLTVGHQYLIQMWVSDARAEVNGRTETFGGSGTLSFKTASSGMGQYVIGRFTADAATQSITINANTSAQVNLMQVRDLSAAAGNGTATPSTLAVGQTSTITVIATSKAGLPVTGVTLDASVLGIPSEVTLDPAGGNVFTNTITVGTGTIYGSQTLVATVTDSGNNKSQVSIPVFLPTPAAHKASAATMAAWQADRFGMFIHWGPVSLTGLEISWSRANTNPACPNNGPTPAATYDDLYTQFNPTDFNAAEWVALARNAGMKYIVLTAKHCDGFLLWDSQASSYNIMNSPFRRDICKELADAAHAAGMKIGWYFSPCDWKDPRFRNSQNPEFVKTMQAELRELLSNYGKIDMLWFDTDSGSNVYDVTNTYAMCRSLQPDIVIDNRLDMGNMGDYYAQAVGPWADYYTPEQRIGEFDNQRPWETCLTVGNQWSFSPNDSYKSTLTCLTDLLLCAGGDGNLLLNIGPTPAGTFVAGETTPLNEMGAWLAQYGKSVYGTRGGPYKSASNFASTRAGKVIYLHLFPPQSTVTLPPLPTNIVSASVLTGGDVTVAQSDSSVVLNLSATAISNSVVTVQLNLADSAMDIPVLAPGTLSAAATVTTWQTPQTIANSSEVNTQGSLVMARQATASDYGGYADQTVNGVPFIGNVNTINGVTFSVQGHAGYDSRSFISTKTLSGVDAAAYQTILAGAWYGTTSPVTASLSGLTAGNTYLIQIWADDFRKYSNARTQTVTTAGGVDINAPTLHYLTGDGVNAGSGTGQYVIGTFTAAENSVSFNLTGNQISQLNAFQLRDITAHAYDTWSTTTHSLSGASAAFDADPDSDGLANGLEWILGGNPNMSSASIAPAATPDASNNFVITFTRLEASIPETTLTLEYTTDLTTWPGQVTIGTTNSGPDANGVIVSINTTPSPDSVTVTIPASNATNGRIFTRLRARD